MMTEDRLELPSMYPDNWAITVNTSLIDPEGKLVCCKCGEMAVNAVIGKEVFTPMCHDCTYPKEKEEKNDRKE